MSTTNEWSLVRATVHFGEATLSQFAEFVDFLQLVYDKRAIVVINGYMKADITIPIPGRRTDAGIRVASAVYRIPCAYTQLQH